MSDARIIRLIDGRPHIIADSWRHLEADAPWDGASHVLLPLTTALAQPERVAAGRPVGVWLAPNDEPAQLLPLLGSIDLIAVQFPAFTDGRGYSTASLLRRRFGWQGELRAFGDVLRDQLFYMKRVGFDSFALRSDRSPEDALPSLSDFSDVYQGSVEPALPAYRRRETATASR